MTSQIKGRNEQVFPLLKIMSIFAKKTLCQGKAKNITWLWCFFLPLSIEEKKCQRCGRVVVSPLVKVKPKEEPKIFVYQCQGYGRKWIWKFSFFIIMQVVIFRSLPQTASLRARTSSSSIWTVKKKSPSGIRNGYGWPSRMVNRIKEFTCLFIFLCISMYIFIGSVTSLWPGQSVGWLVGL